MAQIRFTTTGVDIRETPVTEWVPFYNEAALDRAVGAAIERTRGALQKKSMLDQMALALEATNNARSLFAQNLEKILNDNEGCCQTVECLRHSIEKYIVQLKGGL